MWHSVKFLGDSKEDSLKLTTMKEIGGRSFVARSHFRYGCLCVVALLIFSSRTAFAFELAQTGTIFGSPTVYDSGGRHAMAVAVADLNGDGRPDLVVANQGGTGNCTISPSASVSVLIGNGDGTYQAAASYNSGGFNISAIAVADVTGDGIPDVIVANAVAGNGCPGGTLGLLVGNGDGSFQPVQVIGGGGQTFMTLADVNGDGKLDLITVGGDEVGVSFGNDDGTFSGGGSYSAGGNAVAVAVADVNGDGHPDLIVATGGELGVLSNGVGVLLNNGDGTFQPVVSYAVSGGGTDSVAVADVNRDGKLDLIVASAFSTGGSNTGTLSVLSGNGDGTFQSAVNYSSGGYGSFSVAAADVNGDGIPDILVTNECPTVRTCNSGTSVGVLLSNGDGTFRSPVNYKSGGDGESFLAIADVNGDGRPDAIVANMCATGACANSDAPGDGSVGVLLNLEPTATELGSVPNPSLLGQAVTFTAIVVGQSGGTPTGSVIFKQGSAALGTVPLVDGHADFTTSFATSGTRSVTATYSATGNFSGSTSETLRQTVAKDTTTTVLTSSQNPSSLGQSVTFQATVSPANGNSGQPPVGTVTFKVGSTVLATVTLNGSTATYTTSNLSKGSDKITGAYNGSAEFNKSSATITQIVH
jgi:hypothetical protein